MITGQQLFFILGRERSGTTLLQNLLNNHEAIFIPDEAPFIIFLQSTYGKEVSIEPEKFVEDLLKEPYISLWNINKRNLITQLEQAEHKDFNSYCQIVLNYLSLQKTTWVGDKNPINAIFSKKLNQQFPNAKFIWIVRDYRAQVNSMLKVNFEQKNCTSLAIRWKQYNKAIQKLYTAHPEKVFLVKYEQLVTEPRETLKKICSFLGLDFKEEMVNNNDRSNNRLLLHHKSLQYKISSKNLNQWQEKLSEKQVKTCEFIAGDFAQGLGYNRLFSPTKFFPINIYGFIIGYAYLPFLRLFHQIPISIKFWIIKHIIRPNFTFWQESERHLKNN